jgi:ParB family transcriptional regulator, chromosome partitioning protein
MQNRGLGRGLAALISETAAESRAGQVREIPVEQISPNPYQPRLLFDPITMRDLVDSVKAHGVLQPILVREVGHERYQLVAGERRFRAAQEAGLKAIPALVRECGDKEMLEIAVVENVQREDIGPLEAARAYRRLIDEFQMTQETVSQRVGKSRSSVANTLRLLQLPQEVQESLEAGEITEGHGRILLMGEDEETMIYAWREAVRKQLNVRDTEQLVKQVRNRGRKGGSETAGGAGAMVSDAELRRSSGVVDPHEAALVERLQDALQTKVLLRRLANGMGRIEIEFYSDEDLERIADVVER